MFSEYWTMVLNEELTKLSPFQHFFFYANFHWLLPYCIFYTTIIEDWNISTMKYKFCQFQFIIRPMNRWNKNQDSAILFNTTPSSQYEVWNMESTNWVLMLPFIKIKEYKYLLSFLYYPVFFYLQVSIKYRKWPYVHYFNDCLQVVQDTKLWNLVQHHSFDQTWDVKHGIHLIGSISNIKKIYLFLYIIFLSFPVFISTSRNLCEIQKSKLCLVF